MSWSISSVGVRAAVESQVTEQASHIKLNDAGEKETAANAVVLITQTLATFDADALVKVEAFGSMGYQNWTDRTRPYQNLSVKVEPILLTANIQATPQGV